MTDNTMELAHAAQDTSSAPARDADPDIQAVEYWNSTHYRGEEQANGRFFMEICDKRAENGQLFVDVATEDGDFDDLMAATFEINRLPGSKTDVQCMHLHISDSELAMSVYKQGNRYILRPENNVTIRQTVLPNGELAYILE
jgi:hypothetical protein